MIPSAHLDRGMIAQVTAGMLLEIGAVDFNADTPFIHASGKKAPTYVDCRRLLSFPRVRATLMDFLSTLVMREVGFEALTTVAGGETAGIPFAALVAERMGLPMSYVRKKPKGYGRNARIEGVMGDGDRVLLVEDLATDGGSKIGFVEAIRETGASCCDTAVIFSYGIFPEMERTLASHDIRLHALCTWADVLAEARQRDAFDAATLDQVAKYLSDPVGWAAAQA